MGTPLRVLLAGALLLGGMRARRPATSAGIAVALLKLPPAGIPIAFWVGLTPSGSVKRLFQRAGAKLCTLKAVRVRLQRLGHNLSANWARNKAADEALAAQRALEDAWGQAERVYPSSALLAARRAEADLLNLALGDALPEPGPEESEGTASLDGVHLHAKVDRRAGSALAKRYSDMAPMSGDGPVEMTPVQAACFLARRGSEGAALTAMQKSASYRMARDLLGQPDPSLARLVYLHGPRWVIDCTTLPIGNPRC